MSSDALCCHFRPPIKDNVTFPFPVNFRKLVVILRHVREFLILWSDCKQVKTSFDALFYASVVVTRADLRIFPKQRGERNFTALTKVTVSTIFPPCNFRWRWRGQLRTRIAALTPVLFHLFLVVSAFVGVERKYQEAQTCKAGRMYSTRENLPAINCAEKRPRLDSLPLSHEPRVWPYSPRPEMYPYQTDVNEHNKSNSR